MSRKRTKRRFLAAGPGKISDELRLELVLRPGRIVAEGDDGADAAAAEADDAGLLVEVGIAARKNLDGIGLKDVIADRIAARFGISAAPELGGDSGGRGLVAHGDGFRGGEDLGGIGEQAGAQLLVEEAGVFGVEIGKSAETDDYEKGESDDQDPAKGTEGKTRQRRVARDAHPHFAFGRLGCSTCHYR
jgi:hypothetical protein